MENIDDLFHIGARIQALEYRISICLRMLNEWRGRAGEKEKFRSLSEYARDLSAYRHQYSSSQYIAGTVRTLRSEAKKYLRPSEYKSFSSALRASRKR